MDTDTAKILLDVQRQLGDTQKQIGAIDERTVQILRQTEKTNGAVGDLQRRTAILETKQARSQGAKGVLKWALGFGERLLLFVAGVLVNEWRSGR